jgi:hypothetical protein
MTQFLGLAACAIVAAGAVAVAWRECRRSAPKPPPRFELCRCGAWRRDGEACPGCADGRGS